ncbi:SDR family oxidoreductase [Pseudomaricurvus alkylphenolicus]|uniref:SDR family NAD(P)-dependent oxidoreductase n=1 Tax=Pseudomaricurvus alkylphenolicus TaxID=1306991 RepID=UPI00141E19A8|nr:SDR family oxidoreductase [Pseudomaricurvus alkylphenolicus]NIB38740.1 SDR family oxidoreductase [Pseudomaricurvus alkylphenolicus]
MQLGLEGKVALVTGGARDVGGEISRTLAAEGATVAINYRGSADEANALVDEITNKGGKAFAYQADVTDYEQVKAMVDQVVADHGALNILVNNAGLVIQKRFTESDPDQWKKQTDVCHYGIINACHAASQVMQAQKDGRIVNIVGDSARVGEAYLSVKAATGGSAMAFTKSLAKELGRFNVRANVVAFGMLETSHSDKEWLEQNRAKIERQYPLRRMGFPQDVAPTVVFLTSDATSWVTGQVVSVSGGYSMVG